MKKERPNIEQIKISDDKSASDVSAIETGTYTRRPLTTPMTISKPATALFHVNFAINPLVAAAMPALTICCKIQGSQQALNYEQIYHTLLHEVRVFEEKARKLDYRSAIILAARYFVCSYIDEIMQQQPNLKELWQKDPLLSATQGEKWGGERFFLILERASDDSKGHIDLLELGFLCLNLGYKGKYAKNHNLQELEHLRDNLYVLIQRIRGAASSNLFLRTKQTERNFKLKPTWRFNKFIHPIIAGVIIVGGLLSVYIPYSQHLHKLTEPLNQKVKQIKEAG